MFRKKEFENEKNTSWSEHVNTITDYNEEYVQKH